MQEVQVTCILSLGWEDPLEKGMATHSSILVWRGTRPDGPLLPHSDLFPVPPLAEAKQKPGD